MVDDFFYTFRARVIDVYDGDTIRVDLQLGFYVSLRNQQLRLLKVFAPEVRGRSRKRGLKSRDYLRKLILDKEVVVLSIKSSARNREDRNAADGRGRWIAVVWLLDSFHSPADFGNSVNAQIVRDGFALAAEKKRKRRK